VLRDGQCIQAGEQLPGACIMTHYDHKPQNALRTSGGIGILDWDEATYCNPRLEAVESALLWSEVSPGALARRKFGAYLDAYLCAGGALDRLSPADFAKRVASLYGWIDYLGRRALGEFGDTEREKELAVHRSLAAIRELASVLRGIEEWTSWLD